MNKKSCRKCSRCGIREVKCHLQSISINPFCCIGSFPDKKRGQEDDLDSSYEASVRVKLVRYLLLFFFSFAYCIPKSLCFFFLEVKSLCSKER